jgi:hypothetical protein
LKKSEYNISEVIDMHIPHVLFQISVLLPAKLDRCCPVIQAAVFDMFIPDPNIPMVNLF